MPNSGDDGAKSQQPAGHSPRLAPEEDIAARGVLQRLMPIRRAEQRVGITRGPFDPGGQPSLNDRGRFHLGLSAWNVSGGANITKQTLEDPARHWGFADWSRCVEVAKEADRIGLSLLLADGDQRGFGGATSFHEASLDSLTSVAALSQMTSRILLASTANTDSSLHPLYIARFGGNFDHMSNGRWALHVATRADREEREQLGLDGTTGEAEGSNERADEFVTLMKHWWSMPTAFEFIGEYFKSRHVHMVGPRPTRKPRPFLLTTAHSTSEIDFAAKHCDWLLCVSPGGELGEINELARQARLRASHHYGRELKTFVQVYVVMAEQEETALGELAQLVGTIDREATDNFVRRRFPELIAAAGESAQTCNAVQEIIGRSTYERLALGLGAIQMVGSYDRIAEQLSELAACGHHGAVLSFFDPLRGLHELEDEIIPRLRKAGLT